MKWKLVKIGEYYAMRRWSLFWFSYQYLDLKHLKFTWNKDDKFFTSCLTKDHNHPEFIRAMKDKKV